MLLILLFIILIFERIFFKYQIAYRVFLLKKYLINILKLEENKDFTEKATELIARDFEMVFGDKKPTNQELEFCENISKTQSIDC